MRAQHSTSVSVVAFDTGAARRYLVGIQALISEALNSSDPRVLIGALEVLARQRATVREFFRHEED